MRDLFDDDHLYERLLALLDSTDPRDRLYVYRLRGGRKLTPALYKDFPFSDLLNWLRDEHGGGQFALMIRRGETMLLAGSVSVITPRDRRQQ